MNEDFGAIKFIATIPVSGNAVHPSDNSDVDELVQVKVDSVAGAVLCIL